MVIIVRLIITEGNMKIGVTWCLKAISVPHHVRAFTEANSHPSIGISFNVEVEVT